jgi:hypothetical protein
MATQNNLHVSDDLLAELQSEAQAAGKTVDELAASGDTQNRPMRDS